LHKTREKDGGQSDDTQANVDTKSKLNKFIVALYVMRRGCRLVVVVVVGLVVWRIELMTQSFILVLGAAPASGESCAA